MQKYAYADRRTWELLRQNGPSPKCRDRELRISGSAMVCAECRRHGAQSRDGQAAKTSSDRRSTARVEDGRRVLWGRRSRDAGILGLQVVVAGQVGLHDEIAFSYIGACWPPAAPGPAKGHQLQRAMH